jgi:hypothetical protein
VALPLSMNPASTTTVLLSGTGEASFLRNDVFDKPETLGRQSERLAAKEAATKDGSVPVIRVCKIADRLGSVNPRRLSRRGSRVKKRVTPA